MIEKLEKNLKLAVHQASSWLELESHRVGNMLWQNCKLDLCEHPSNNNMNFRSSFCVSDTEFEKLCQTTS